MESKIAVISIIVEHAESVETLSGKIGKLPGVSAKTAASNITAHGA